ncbi:MAG TPA: ABC transporter ATP-binding protein [Hyphomicrobiales bacterium]|nr:ABC transporter ATP-binding protein [Hyphomicrobiales bacterium]
MSRPVIEATGLAKRYGGVAAVAGIDLTIDKGEVFGLLGPNGAGKTTTILMLLGLTEPTAGKVEVLGLDPLRRPLAVKRRVGYLPDQVGFYGNLSGAENLRYTARLAGIERAEADRRIKAAAERVGIAEAIQRRVAGYSHGMRQRLGLAEILVKQAEIAILDEPTGGLDPEATHEFLGLVRAFKSEGMTILLSSHLLAMVESVCDRVALFHAGKIGLAGRVEDLVREVLGGSYVINVQATGPNVEARLRTLEGVSSLQPDGPGHWRIEADRDLRPAVARAVVEGGGALTGIALARLGLDDVYTRYFREVRHAA